MTYFIQYISPRIAKFCYLLLETKRTEALRSDRSDHLGNCFFLVKNFLDTCEAAKIMPRIQRRVLPLLTEPPSLVNNVCPSMLRKVFATSIVSSKTKMRDMLGLGVLWTKVDV